MNGTPFIEAIAAQYAALDKQRDVREQRELVEDGKGVLNMLDVTSKPSNPKDIIGSDKLPFHLWPETATALGCLGLLDGALKYGRSNWRVAGVRTSIYVDAARRHCNAYFEGEDVDPESGLDHRAHALACLAIVVDAEAAGKLVDDRQIKGGYRSWVDRLTPHVARLKAKYLGRSPRHYTIADSPEVDVASPADTPSHS